MEIQGEFMDAFRKLSIEKKLEILAEMLQQVGEDKKATSE